MEDTGEIMTHLTTGAVVVYAIQGAKAIPWLRWIDVDTKKVNVAVSFLAASAIALGITIVGDGTTGWTLTIPPVAMLASGAWEAVKQFVLQQLLYDGAIQKSGARS